MKTTLRNITSSFIVFLSALSLAAQADTYPASMQSGSIPTVIIDTDNAAPIEDKINYIPGNCHIAVPDGDQWQPTGSAAEPLRLNIRGRGNWSWTYSPKRAYKLKFDSKASVLGMPAHKHFALICYDPYYPTLWLAPAIGMELGRLVGFDWTPRMEPVEVVLNGEYRGIYLLVESMKTGKDRLNITTQPEESTDSDLLPYGWLVEIDNQNDDYQISVPSKNRIGKIRITHKEPELLSDAQRQWLTDEFTHLTELVESPELYPDESWTDHFDLQSLAKYMVVREVLHDVDGYSGSHYLYKDINSEKWCSGPLWDMELWPTDKKAWIADDGHWSLLNYIPFMMKSPLLRQAFIDQWNEFYPDKFNAIYDYIDSFAAIYPAADRANTARWPTETISLDDKISTAKARLKSNSRWIDNNLYWALPTGIESNAVISVDIDYRLSGRTLYLSSNSTIRRIDIVDMRGRVLLSHDAGHCNGELDLSALAPGCYIVAAKVGANSAASHSKICLK